MANSAVKDILQAIGFSELIEKFEAVSYEDFTALHQDSERIKEIVPKAQVDDFIEKLEAFFYNVKSDDITEGMLNDEDVLQNKFEEQQDENVDHNNANQSFIIENIDIKKILQGTFEGRKLLSWYKPRNFLSQGKRKRLINFVIAGVLNVCNRDLTDADFKVLSRKIVEVFPKECQLVYYQPRVKKSESNTGRVKKRTGKLLHRYRNVIKKYKEHTKSEAANEVVEVVTAEIEASEHVQASIEWLQNEEEPWKETMRHWIITANYRQSQIETDINKISYIYEKWPILKCPKGYLLIIEDFSFHKFTDDQNSIKNFNDFYLKASQVKPLRKDDHTLLLKSMLDNTDLKEDDGILIRLMLLRCMLPSTARIPVGNRKRWKPSAVESLEGIVTRIKIHGDIEKAKADRNLYALSKKLTVQPYIIVVEEDDYSVDSVYVCIDDILYEIPLLLEALDVCFKSFHVFNARYTAQSEHIWLLLQLGLYKFRTKWDSAIIGVNEMLNDMGCLLSL